MLASAAKNLPAEEREKHRKNLVGEPDEAYVARCAAERSERYLECALAGRTTEDLARCDPRR